MGIYSTIATTSLIMIIALTGCSDKTERNRINYVIGKEQVTLEKSCIQDIKTTNKKNLILITLKENSSCANDLKNKSGNNKGKYMYSYFLGKEISPPAIIHSALTMDSYYQSVDSTKTKQDILNAYSK